MSAPFQLVPTSGSFLPMHPRVSGSIRDWPAPEAVALRRSNEWPAPSLSTMAWADDAFEMRAVTITTPPLFRLAAPLTAPPATLPAPAPFAAAAPLAAPTAMPAPLAMPTAVLAPPAPAAALAPPELSSAPAVLPPPVSPLAPPIVERTVLPAPVGAPIDVDVDSEPPAPRRTRRPIVRLQDAIITLSVAAATALITLVLLSQL